MHYMGKIKETNDQSRDESAIKRIAPDHYATEAGFVEVFLENEDLLREFPLYAREFLKHEGANLEEYQDLDYGVSKPGLNANGIYLCVKIVSLMYQAAKKGSSYAQGMMVYIYKTYYKAEYNRLKRLKSLSCRGLFDLAARWDEDGECHIQIRMVVRYLCMAPMLNIEISEECDDFYTLAEDTYNDTSEDLRKKRSFRISETLLEESRSEVSGWLGKNGTVQVEKESRDITPQWEKAREFACCALEYCGYSRDYLTLGAETPDLAEMELYMTKARAILKKRFRSDPTYEEVQVMAVIFEMAVKLMDEIDTVNDTVDNFLGLSSECALGEPDKPRFNLERLNAAVGASKSALMEKKKKEAVKSTVTSEKTESDENDKEKEHQMLAEIERLRTKLHNVEKDNDHLREDNRKICELSDTIGILKQQQADDRRELHALREHVYKLTEEETVPSASIADMEMVLAEKKIVIIGGIDSWSNRLKGKFGNWKFISTDVSAIVDLKVFDGADCTYFFTDYLAHRTYVGYVRALRKRGLPFGYIHSTNYENNVKQIYEDTYAE